MLRRKYWNCQYISDAFQGCDRKTKSAHYLIVDLFSGLAAIGALVAIDLGRSTKDGSVAPESGPVASPRPLRPPAPTFGRREESTTDFLEPESSAVSEVGLVSKPQSKASRAASARRVHLLFSENYRQIWRLLRRFGVPAQSADDEAQKVFLILAERINDVRLGSERAFLYGTAYRVATGFRRSNKREKPSDQIDEQKSQLPRPDELADRKRARDLLDTILAQMEDDLKTVFILYELEGFTTPEIADLLEVPLGTAASRLRRARERFSGLVADHSQAVPPTALQVPGGAQ